MCGEYGKFAPEKKVCDAGILYDICGSESKEISEFESLLYFKSFGNVDENATIASKTSASPMTCDLFAGSAPDRYKMVCPTYGRLYDWTTALDIDSKYVSEYATSIIGAEHQGVCPDGWHVPSEQEFLELKEGYKDCAYKFKAVDAGWSGDATGETGFNAIPTGWYDSEDDYGYRLESHGALRMWTTADESSVSYTPIKTYAYTFKLGYSDNFIEGYNLKTDRLPVRCVKNK